MLTDLFVLAGKDFEAGRVVKAKGRRSGRSPAGRSLFYWFVRTRYFAPAKKKEAFILMGAVRVLSAASPQLIRHQRLMIRLMLLMKRSGAT